MTLLLPLLLVSYRAPFDMRSLAPARGQTIDREDTLGAREDDSARTFVPLDLEYKPDGRSHLLAAVE